MARKTERSARPLSKSKYLTGLACHRLLWHEVHAGDLTELAPDLEAQFRMEQGNAVEARARAEFPGGVLVASPDFAMEQRLEETARALVGGAPFVFEATVAAAGAIVSADVLRRVSDGLELIEIKQSLSVKDDDLEDVAFQLWVLREAGLAIPRAFLMHLNKTARYPELAELFVIEGVTDKVEPLLSAVPLELAAQRAMLAAAEPPSPVLVRQCRKPKPCPLFEKCWPGFPEHHVSTLYQIRWKQVDKLLAAGRVTVDQLDEIETSYKEARRQIRAVRAGRRVVEEGLGAALDVLRPPVAWLDFESVGLAIPAWPMVAPHENVPVQFSVHVTGVSGTSAHQWLADPLTDPRPALAEALVRACGSARTVVAYNAKFEKDCLKHLADAVPAYRDVLGEIHARVVDLLPIVRDHVYDPAFGGGFGLKKVLPALVSDPELSYDGLAVSDGGTATALLARLLLEPERIGGPPERERLRAQLLAYCALDTRAMLRLAEALRAIAT
jgi:hypothetical protein